MSHLMLDIETLATGPDAVILTLGAIKFDPFSDRIGDGIYLKPNVDEQIQLGREVNQGTVEWWAQQDEVVREEAMSEQDRISLDEFAKELNKFVVAADMIWAQGPCFDIVILENLYRQIGKPVPWPYYLIRDSRTLLQALGDNRQAGRAGAHNALTDCVYQAEAVQAAVARYKLTRL